MLIVCDNSVLSALAETGLLELLSAVAGKITIPESVAAESRHAGAPDALQTWIANPSVWLTVVADPCPLLEETATLGPGEAAAITLAWNHRQASVLIIDEKRGRAVAAALGLAMTGTLALLTEAAILVRVDFEHALTALLATGFRLAEPLIEAARRRVADSGL